MSGHESASNNERLPSGDIRPWPEVRDEGRWAIEFMEEDLRDTQDTPEELRTRAEELRAHAAETDQKGARDAALALADRYEATAAQLLSAGRG